MTPEQEKTLSALEKTVSEFNLVTSGLNVQGGFDKPLDPNKATPMERLEHLEKMHENFQIIGGHNVTVEGSLQTGYAICARCPDTGAATSGGVIPSPPPPSTGACCEEDGTCSIQTAPGCLILGGVYQGDGTVCFPNPCPQPPATGACCLDGVCSIETETICTGMGGAYQGDNTNCDTTGACCNGEDCSIATEACCTDNGGIYQGDDTTCDPNPCIDTGACCVNGFCDILTESECSDEGGVWLGGGSTCEESCCLCFNSPQDGQFYCNKTVTAVVSGSNPGGCDCTLTANFSSTFSCDPLTGTVTSTGCSGTWHKVVTLTDGFICTPSDVTDNWEFQTDCLGADRCGWNSSCAVPSADECCGGFAGCGCGIADLSTYTDNCSCDCCPASPGCYNVDITVTYS